MAKIFSISALFLVVGLLNAATNSAYGCPSYWTKFGNFCYRFRGEPLSFNDAKDRCRETITCDGSTMADLASIHSEAENNFVYRLWRTSFIDGLDAEDFPGSANRASSVWLGGNDMETEGAFVWTDGGSFDYQSWSQGQPDNAGNGENCLSMWKKAENTVTNGSNTWNDLFCDRPIPFVCKMPDV